MPWCGKCCGAPAGERESELPEQSSQENQHGTNVRREIYNRMGRVERFKHGETVCFLSKAVVIAILMILLVQFIASQEVCSVELPKSSLPPAVQRILNGKDLKDSLRCPYDDTLDVSFTFEEVLLTDKVVENVTMFKVNFADIIPAKRSINETLRQTESLVEVCGKKCYIKSCKCVEKMILSNACYLDKYQYGLQLEPATHDEASHSIFGIYFVISVIMIGITILFYGVYRITTHFWGGKRVGHAVII